MRKKIAFALAATAALSLGVGVAYGEGTDRPAPPEHPAAGNHDVVTLPTGDRVRVAPDGSAMFLPGAGRESVRYFSPEAPGDAPDRIVIPEDASDEVASGKWDARLFNIDALRRAGFDDARTVRDPAVLGADPLAAGDATGETATDIGITLVGRDGRPPTTGYVTWNDLTNPGNSGTARADSSGVVEVQLPPGRYGFQYLIQTSLGGGITELTGAVRDVAVESTPVKQLIDAREGNPISVSVDRRNAVQQPGEFRLATYLEDGTKGWGFTAGYGPEDRLYGIPSHPRGHEAGMVLRSQFVSPGNIPADDRYAYNLVLPTMDGIPSDLSYHVADDELAKLSVNYQALATPARGYRSSYGYFRGTGSGFNGGTGYIDVPGSRTEFYTAHPDVAWEHSLYVQTEGAVPDEDPFLWIRRAGGTYQPSSNDLDFHGTAPSIGMEYATFHGGGSLGESLQFSPAPFSSGPPDQLVQVNPITGTARVQFNDKVIYDGPSMGAGVYLAPGEDGEESPVPAGDGRYTVTLAGTPGEGVNWLHPGASFQGEWAFDRAYTEGWAPITAGTVRFDTDGVVDSYAKAGSTIDVNLEYAAQPGTPTPTCTAMTFDVSFDDGATWQPVDITRDGNHATATVTHPTDAEYVSLRFTAEDEAGNTVTHSTIRSYGLN